MMEGQDPGVSFRHMLTALIVNTGLDGSQSEFLSSNMPADVQVSYFFMTEMIVDKLLPAVSKIESIVFAGESEKTATTTSRQFSVNVSNEILQPVAQV